MLIYDCNKFFQYIYTKKRRPISCKVELLCVHGSIAGTNLKVAKLDAAHNEFPDEFAITGYPTLFFVPTGDKKNPVKFVGERNFENVIDFIEKNRNGKSEPRSEL